MILPHLPSMMQGKRREKGNDQNVYDLVFHTLCSTFSTCAYWFLHSIEGEVPVPRYPLLSLHLYQ
jgi:hypothetical protein